MFDKKVFTMSVRFASILLHAKQNEDNVSLKALMSANFKGFCVIKSTDGHASVEIKALCWE